MKINNPTLRFYIWAPNMFEFKGGIQVYSAFLLKALQCIYPTASYQVFLKHDKRATVPEFLAHTEYYFSGYWPLPLRTIAFSIQLLLYSLLKRCDLIIATHPNFAIVAYWIKCINGTPYWVVAHGVDAWNITKRNLQTALQNADCVLPVSGYTRLRLLQEQQLTQDKLLVLPNTFEANRFQIGPKPKHLLERYHLSPNQPVLLTVARLADTEREKGYDQVIKALPIILKAVPNVHYMIVGKGPDQHRIEQLIQLHQLQQHVTLAGFVPDQELCDYYNLCDLFVMPSKQEGFGIVYLEALACGRPVIGGNQDGALDALCQGELGVLVDPNNVDEIAQVTVQVLQKRYPHPLLYQPKVLRQKVIAMFGFESFTKTLANYLKVQFEN